MASANISVNTVDGSNTALPINTLVQLNNQNTGGETTFAWTILDQPVGAVDALSSAAIQNPTFTPRKEGSYLIRLVVNQGQATEQTDIIVCAVRQMKSLLRIPAAGEETAADAADGWAVDANLALQMVDRLRADPGMFVAVAGAAGLLKGNVLRVAGVATIKSGLPGQEILPSCTLGSASTAAGVDEQQLVCEGGVDGSSTPASGALIYVRARGLYSTTLTITAGAAVGDIAYVTNAGGIDRVAGTQSKQIGHFVFVSGTTARVWIGT